MVKLEELGRTIRDGCEISVEVHAVDPMVYVAYQVDGEERIPIRAEGRFGMSFPSRHAAQRALRAAGLQSVTFVHRSPYGEMIGMEGTAADSEFREVVKL